MASAMPYRSPKKLGFSPWFSNCLQGLKGVDAISQRFWKRLSSGAESKDLQFLSNWQSRDTPSRRAVSAVGGRFQVHKPQILSFVAH